MLLIVIVNCFFFYMQTKCHHFGHANGQLFFNICSSQTLCIRLLVISTFRPVFYRDVRNEMLCTKTTILQFAVVYVIRTENIKCNQIVIQQLPIDEISRNTFKSIAVTKNKKKKYCLFLTHILVIKTILGGTISQ